MVSSRKAMSSGYVSMVPRSFKQPILGPRRSHVSSHRFGHQGDAVHVCSLPRLCSHSELPNDVFLSHILSLVTYIDPSNQPQLPSLNWILWARRQARVLSGHGAAWTLHLFLDSGIRIVREEALE